MCNCNCPERKIPQLHFNTYHTGIGLTEQCLLSQISEILTCISRINEPIPGMFVLYLNAFLMVIPDIVIKVLNILKIWEHFELLMPAAW